jgi:single-strand DNA-binding protein
MSCNIAFVHGVLSSTPEIRTLPSGARLASLQITVRADDGPTTSLPVSLAEPPAWVEAAAVGDEVVAVGEVRRRFFRAGGATASRVELAAANVVRATDRRGAARVRDRAVQRLSNALD